MWTAIFATTTLICAIGWLKRYTSCTAMIYYMTKKQYELPNDKEIEECTAFVVRHMIQDLTK